MDRYQRAAAFADRIEAELRNLNAWRSEPLPESAYQSREAFLADTMTFYQWLQFILLVRIRDIVQERGEFPAGSQVSTYAIRALDGAWEAGDLIQILCEFDSFIEGHNRAPEQDAEPLAPTPPNPVPEPEPVEPPLEVTRRYWQTRDAALLHSSPRARPGHDTQLAQHVFNTAGQFVAVVGEPQQTADGIAVATIVEADRGSWVIHTVLRQDNEQWRVDLSLSLNWTTSMFLRQRNIHPPYTETDDARGRAMQFWTQILNRNDRWARELVTPESAGIPRFGEGQIDEFFWYVGHTEEGDTATVHVLMNTHAECRTWLTRMVRRDGSWFVDLPATLAD